MFVIFLKRKFNTTKCALHLTCKFLYLTVNFSFKLDMGLKFQFYTEDKCVRDLKILLFLFEHLLQ